VLGQRWTIIMPKEVPPSTVSMKAGDHVGIASGTFILKNYTPSTSIEFVKNPNYFEKGRPYLDGITEPIMPDESTMVAGFRAGRVDAGEVRTSQFITELQRTDPKLQNQVCPYPAPFVVDMRGDRPPLNNIKVRHALSMAIDRDAMGKVAWAGQYFPKHSPVHAGLGDWALQLKDYPPETAKVIAYNPAEAKRLMAEAGYASGFEATLNFSGLFPGQAAMAEFLTSAWGEIGVKVKLKPHDRSTYTAISAAPQGGEWGDMGVFFASSATVYEALFHYFKSGLPRNLSRVNDPEVDRLVAKMLATADEKERRAVVADLQKHLVQRQYRIELPQSATAEFYQPWVKNVWYRTDAWADADAVKFAWLDK
jgi:peptide/nickel transport system substrate-binding protein